MKTAEEWSMVWFDYKTKESLCKAIQADARHEALASTLRSELTPAWRQSVKPRNGKWSNTKVSDHADSERGA